MNKGNIVKSNIKLFLGISAAALFIIFAFKIQTVLAVTPLNYGTLSCGPAAGDSTSISCNTTSSNLNAQGNGWCFGGSGTQGQPGSQPPVYSTAVQTWTMNDDNMSYLWSVWRGSYRDWNDASINIGTVNGSTVLQERSDTDTNDPTYPGNGWDSGHLSCTCGDGACGGQDNPPAYTFFDRTLFGSGTANVTAQVFSEGRRNSTKGTYVHYTGSTAFGAATIVCTPGQRNHNANCEDITGTLTATLGTCSGATCTATLNWSSNSVNTLNINRDGNLISSPNTGVTSPSSGAGSGTYQDTTLLNVAGTHTYCIDGFDGAGAPVFSLACASVTVGTCTISDFHAIPASPTYGSTNTLYFTLSSASSYTITEQSGFDATQTGVASTGSYVTNAITQNRVYLLTCGNASQTVSLTLPPPPVVTLTGNPTTVTPGSSSTISWSISNATSCTNHAGYTSMPAGNWSTGGSGSASSGALSTSKTYEIDCSGSGGFVTSNSLTVNVVGSPTASLTANGSHNLTLAPNAPVTFTWSSTNGDTWSSTAAATPASCPGQGPWSINTSAGTSSGTILPSQAGCVYTLTYLVKNSLSGQQAQDVVTLTVTALSSGFSATPNPVPTCSSTGSTTITASYSGNYDVRQGSTSGTIVWSGSGTTSRTVTVGSGTAFYMQQQGNTSSSGTLGQLVVTLNCTTVGLGPIVNISASPLTVNSGGASTISWSSSNASSCTVSPNGWTGTSGSQSSGPLTTNTTFTVTCSAAGFPDSSASATVGVNPGSALKCFANPASAPAGFRITFYDNGGGSPSWVWSVPGANPDWYTSPNPLFDPPFLTSFAQAGTYVATESAGDGSSANCSVTIYGGNGDLIISDFHLTDAAGKTKTVFNIGENIYPSVTITNQGPDPVYATQNNALLTTPLFSNAPNPVGVNTGSDVAVYAVTNNVVGQTYSAVINPGQSITYSATSNTSAWGNGNPFAKNYWTMSSANSYVARAFVDSLNATIESNKSNNQATSGYIVSASAPVCPSASVALSQSSITSGATSIASAPAGWTGGSFSSSNPAVASMSGSTITGVNAGTSSITGSGWIATNGATNCNLSGTTITVSVPPPTGASLISSDKDITAVNSVNISPAPTVCNGKTGGLPSGSSLIKSGDVVQFQINLCNNVSNPNPLGNPATNITITDQMTNMQQPSGGWNLQYNPGSGYVSLASKACGSLTNRSYCYNSSNNTITINLTGESIAQGSLVNITYSAQISALGSSTTYGRFQNAANVTYNNGSVSTVSQSVTTPLILYYAGIGVPIRTETP